MSSRYSIFDDFTEPPLPVTTYPSTTTQAASSSNTIVNTINAASIASNLNEIRHGNGTASKAPTVSRKGGIIFPSVKNKPTVGNSTFATDVLSYKDVKVSWLTHDRRGCLL